MPISIRIISLLFICVLTLGISSCRSSKYSRGPKEYIEKNGLNNPQKPHEMAAEYKGEGKRHKKQYRKQLYKQWKKKNPGLPRKQNPYR